MPETPQYQSVKSHYGESITLLGNNICSNVYESNKTYTTNKILYGCDISIDNVVVTNNASLEIESMGKTVIGTNTMIGLGSTLITK